MAILEFNAAVHKPMEERTLIPEGEYLFQIIKTEMKDNSKKTAQRLNLQAKVIVGEFKGNVVFIGLNWNHPNKEAQDISDREFKSICEAVGLGEAVVKDSDELKVTPFLGTVVHSAPSGEYVENGETKFKYKPKAEIKKYASATGSPLLDGANVEGLSSAPTTPPWGDED